jgi:hypothetical protein
MGTWSEGKKLDLLELGSSEKATDELNEEISSALLKLKNSIFEGSVLEEGEFNNIHSLLERRSSLMRTSEELLETLNSILMFLEDAEKLAAEFAQIPGEKPDIGENLSREFFSKFSIEDRVRVWNFAGSLIGIFFLAYAEKLRVPIRSARMAHFRMMFGQSFPAFGANKKALNDLQMRLKQKRRRFEKTGNNDIDYLPMYSLSLMVLKMAESSIPPEILAEGRKRISHIYRCPTCTAFMKEQPGNTGLCEKAEDGEGGIDSNGVPKICLVPNKVFMVELLYPVLIRGGIDIIDGKMNEAKKKRCDYMTYSLTSIPDIEYRHADVSDLIEKFNLPEGLQLLLSPFNYVREDPDYKRENNPARPCDTPHEILTYLLTPTIPVKTMQEVSGADRKF